MSEESLYIDKNEIVRCPCGGTIETDDSIDISLDFKNLNGNDFRIGRCNHCKKQYTYTLYFAIKPTSIEVED